MIALVKYVKTYFCKMSLFQKRIKKLFLKLIQKLSYKKCFKFYFKFKEIIKT